MNALSDAPMGLPLDPGRLSWWGESLVRPECVLATADGSIYTADWRGGVVHRAADGRQRLIRGELPSGQPVQPNGIALMADGTFLVAHLGAHDGGVWRLTRDGELTPEQAGELDIRWEAKDEHLTNRPIALAYSENAAGPWNVIASGLPNQGHYAWRMDSRIPAQHYLKLEARDQAGNTAAFITPEPVAIERVRPQGRIRGVRPIGEQARLRTPGAVTPR